MSEIADRGSIYDRIIDEKWVSTPDMGEYMNSKIFLNNLSGMSESSGNSIGPEFYVENPIVETPGYNDTHKVLAFNVKGKQIANVHMTDDITEMNTYDGDTVYLSIADVIDTNKPFKVYYDNNTVFKGVRDYLIQTQKLYGDMYEGVNPTKSDENKTFGLRFIGINAPEAIHYGNLLTNHDDSDVYTTTYRQLVNNNQFVQMTSSKNGKSQVEKSNIRFRPFVEVEKTENGVTTTEYKERADDEVITFIKVRYDKKRYPSMSGNERDVYHEYVKTVKDETTIDDSNSDTGVSRVKVKRVVVFADDEIRQGGIEYANQSKKAQKIVRDAFKNSLETMIVVDTIGLNGVKSEIPEIYKKSYQSSKNNPFFVLWDMWKTIVGQTYAYKYASYQVPGTEANGRFLAAIYVKLMHNGTQQWINLNKKVLYECSLAEARPAYSSSVDSIVNNNYLSNGFKLWTYNPKGQLYLDGVSEDLYKNKDDREEIQKQICGVDLKEMTDHTVMIGDCLFMIPPTSIKVSSQTKVAKTHLLRAKGSIQKQLPKTERIIELDLYFNGSEGINGIPIERELPNGSTKTYYMNGLRSLIAQFKLTPFMPIHNTYINQVLGVDAVSLASYSVSTVPNYPRTLQVTLMMYEFAWIQYMPSQAVPLTEGDELYKNGFSETIHFPILRYYYQQALERGSELASGLYADIEPNDPRYIDATIGNKTALQPIKFMHPTIDFYIPDEDLLKEQKQLKIAMQTRPLGQVFSFNDAQKSFIEKMYTLNKAINELRAVMDKIVPKLTTTSSTELDVVLSSETTNKFINYTETPPFLSHLKNTFPSKAKEKTMKELRTEYLDELNNEVVNIYSKHRQKIGSLINNFELVHRAYKEGKVHYYNIGVNISFNDTFFESDNDLDEIKKYCSKYSSDGLTYNEIFKDNKLQVYYTAEFGNVFNRTWFSMTKPFDFTSTDSISAIRFLSAFSDENVDGSQNFKINEVLENLKDSTDIEDSTSIKFNKFTLSEDRPIVTSMVSSYNNMFANIGLKAIDGHAAQYTGGSDSTLDITMIGNEEAVTTLTTLHRKCVQYLIDYRKILRSSPLRIDSEFTRLLGLHEVTIEAIQIDTIPEYPGKYNIYLRLNSVDRTLRNRESLNKIKDIDNSQMQYNQVAQTKSYFDLKNALGRAELYPDLELPTITELEQAGFYFLKSKFQPERTYPDPDFYFLYWYPTVADNIRTTITEYFSEPSNFNYTISGDLVKDSINLQIKAANGDGTSFYDVLKWDKKDTTYEQMVEDLKSLSMSLSTDNKQLVKDSGQEFAESLLGKMQELDKLNAQIATLQEAIGLSSYNTYMVNSLTNVTVKENDMLDVSSNSTKKDMKAINEKIKELIVEELKNPIKPKQVNNNTNSNQNVSISNDFVWNPKADDSFAKKDKKKFLKELFKTIFNSSKDLEDIDYNYIGAITKAAAIGASAKQPFYSRKNPSEVSIDNLCLPPVSITVTDENGKTINVAKCYYPADNGEILVAHDEETRKRGIIFGDFAIKKYDGSQLGKIFNTTKLKDGFLDPCYNKDIYKLMFKEDIDSNELEENLETYINGILNDRRFAQEAHFRQMLVWLYALLNEETLLGSTIYNASKALDIANKYDDYFKYSTSKDISDEQLTFVANLISSDFIENEDEETDSVSVTVSDKTLKKYKNEIDAVLGEGSYNNLTSGIEQQREILTTLCKQIVEDVDKYIATLAHGLMFSLSAIAMSGLTSSVLGVLRQGSLYQYKSIIDTSLSANSLDGMTDEQKKMCRFSQYASYYIDEEKRHIKTDYQKISYNNKIQRAYLAAANNPSLYLLHSYYDMVVNDKRGSMARAFPTYYMLLIDEGRTIGYWKLQDNFYNMNSIAEFEVVKSRKIAADTARIVMSNMYGIFNADDSDMKDENEYTMRDVWDSIFSPRTYFQKEYDRRENARDINYAKMQPGARVHLRMGYSSNAAELPIIFNGSVAEFENGEMMTLICQGDGVELANPHMFNSLDTSDVEDIKYSSEFFGFKQFLEAWNSLSTPRSMLITPLAAEGTWVQEFIKKWSSGRFFNSNPFGIVHFGDRRYVDIFPTDGEVEQNIYEGLSTPTWDYKKCNMDDIATKGLSEEYGMTEAPSVRVSLSSGFSYWDLMHIASSLSPDFISAIAPFQLRSTVFHGHPRFYYAYDYIQIDDNVLEKRKPFQQYHIYTSYNDIIDNRISTSTDIRTNAVGHYIGPSWLTSEPKTVGPLFVDIDIFPEYQKSTSVNLNYEYKNSDFLPFNVPLADKLVDTFDWVSKPNGEKTAWRATANALKDCIKDMYQGELIVIGDPTVKPYDRIEIADTYEDITGSAEVESVVHMFSTDTGFTTSITPDCISAIDNNYETMYNSSIKHVIIPAITADFIQSFTNIYFHNINRNLYLSVARTSKKVINVTEDIIDSVLTAVGKDALARDALAIDSSMPKVLQTFLNIDNSDIQLYNMLQDLLKGKSVFNTTAVKGSKTFLNIINDLDNIDDVLKSVSVEKYDDLVKMLNNDRFKKTGVAEILSKTDEYTDAIKGLKKSLSLSKDDGVKILKVINDLNLEDDAIKAAANILENSKGAIDFTTSEGKKILKGLRSLANNVDDWTGAARPVAEIFENIAKNSKKGLKVLDKLTDVVNPALTVKGLTSIKTLLLNNIVMLAVDFVVTKSAQEYLTRALRNLQVLTIYPLKKDGVVWTAGLNGHQGSVFGSLTYDEPGWLEKLAIKFFDYGGEWGSEAGWNSPAKYLGFLRDLFITTDEMRDIVNSYKRGNGYTVESHSDDKRATEAQVAIAENLAMKDIQSYSDYKNIYFTKRLTMAQINNKTEEAALAYATKKIYSDNIEQDPTITEKLQCILSNSSVINDLYFKDCFKLAYDFSRNDADTNRRLGITMKNILIYNGGGAVQEVYVKKLPEYTPVVYDIPYLRPDAMILLNHVVNEVMKEIQPDFELDTCNYEEIAKHPFILHSATMVNSSEGWRSTGYLFTLEVKNYDNFSNIINRIEEDKNSILESTSSNAPFSIVEEAQNGYSKNTYTFFVHCPIE